MSPTCPSAAVGATAVAWVASPTSVITITLRMVASPVESPAFPSRSTLRLRRWRLSRISFRYTNAPGELTGGVPSRPTSGLGNGEASVVRSRGHADATDVELLADLRLDLGGELRILLEVRLGVLAALTQPDVPVAEPGARLLDHIRLDAEVDQQTRVADPLVEHDVELGLPERRRDLVLHHLHPRPVPDLLLAVLDRADPADVQAQARVELQRTAA